MVRPQGKRALPRRLLLVLLLNLALFAVYYWTDSETTDVTIVLTGDEMVASVDGTSLAFHDDGPADSHIGLFLEDALPQARATSHWLSFPGLGDFIADHIDSSWQRVIVGSGNGAAALEIGHMSWRQVSQGRIAAPLAANEEVRGPASRIEATLRRSTTSAGIIVRGDVDNGLLLLLRPQYRDVGWFRLDHGQLEGPLAIKPWLKPALPMFQADLRLLLWTQQAAIGLTLAALILALLLACIAGIQVRVRPVAKAFMAARVSRAPVKGAPTVAPPPHSPHSDHLKIQISRAASVARGLVPRRATIAKVRRRDFPLFGMVPFDSYRLLAIALALTVAAVAAYIAKVVLEGIPHVQDDVTYLFQARVFALGRLWVPASPIPAAFEQEFIVNVAGKAFGKYPPGQPLALLPGVLAGVPWLINPLEAGLTVYVVYLIGKQVYGNGQGLLAALLLASSPFFLFMSGSMMAHPTGLLFISLFTLLFVKVLRDQRPLRNGLLAGAALGMAFLTRPYTAIALGAPFAIYALWRIVPMNRRELMRYIPVAAGFAPVALALVAYNSALTGNALQNPMELWWPFDKVGFGPGIGIRGIHTLADGLWNTNRNLSELMRELFGWPMVLTLAMALFPFLTLRAKRWDWLFLSAWLTLILAHVAWWADGVMYGPRYYYESIVFLVLLTSSGTFTLGKALSAAASAIRRRLDAIQPASFRVEVVPYFAIGVLVATNVFFNLPGQFSLHQGYNYVNGSSLRAVNAANIHNAVVFVDLGNWYEWWNYGSVFPANSPYLDGDVVFARDRGADGNKQVAALYPGRSYYRLSGTALSQPSYGQ